MTQDMASFFSNRLSVILDEIDSDFRKATIIAKAAGLTAVELRMGFGRSIVELSNFQLREIKDYLESQNMRVCALASPLLKCFLPGEEGKGKVGDQFGFQATDYETHRELVPRLIEIADFFGVDAIRCFSFWDTGSLDVPTFHRIAEFLAPVAEDIGSVGKFLILENEPSCFVKTAQEAGRLLSFLNTPWMGLLWDPGNGKLKGEKEEDALPQVGHWVKHVHLKDFVFQDNRARFVAPGAGLVDYRLILSGLWRMGYKGFLSFEPCMGTWGETAFVQMVKRFVQQLVLLADKGG